MKKILFLTLAFVFCAIANLSAQTCTTTWPYLYDDFKDALVYFTNGSQSNEKVNIHVLNSTLHFIDNNDVVRESKMKDVLVVELGADKFYSKAGKMMKVVANSESGFIGEVTVADMASLNSSTAAYGASANSSSVRKLSSVEGGGPTANTNHMDLKNSKEEGKILPLSKEYYIVADGMVFPAQKKALETLLPNDKKVGLKDFLKKNKIQWKNPSSLLKLVEYINGTSK